MSSFLEFNTDFSLYGIQHITVIVVIICISIGLPVFAKRSLSPNQNLLTSRILAVMISCWVILYDVIHLYLGKFNYKTDLPLDICNFIGLLIPFLMWNPNQRLFPFLYFYIMAGTTQAVFVPHLFDGFPNFVFIKFWIVHGGLIVYILYLAVVWNFQLTFKDFLHSFLFLQPYLLLLYLTSKLIGANYLFLVQKPLTYSILDHFGPWPIYILVTEAIMLFLMFMVYLPYINVPKEKAQSIQK